MKKVIWQILTITWAASAVSCVQIGHRGSGGEKQKEAMVATDTMSPDQPTATATDTRDVAIAPEPPAIPYSFHVKGAKKICDAFWDVMCQTEDAEKCFLSDITRDGIPELWLKVGACEGDYELRAYRWSSQQGAQSLFTIPAGHSGFYQGKGYVLQQIAHMGTALWTRISYRGKLVTRDVYHENLMEDGKDDYRKPKEKLLEMLPTDNKALLYACFGL